MDIRSDAGEVTMSAADNGIGLPGDLDVKNSGTLGLELVEILATQLKGTLEVGCRGTASFRATFLE
jgi:two-component sensor histidine kinase